MEKPYQIALLLLQKMELFLEKASEEHVKCYVLPLVYNSLSRETIRIQELCISIVPNISRLVDKSSMKTELLPKLLELATGGGELAIRVQSLLCIGKLLPTLESWMVTDLILPALPKIRSREPAVLMALLGIYKLTAESESVVVSREQWAKSALPFLIPICVENTLNLGQFEQFMAFVKSLIGIVERDQRVRLQQLSAVQEQQMSPGNLDDVMTPDSTITNIDLASLGDIQGKDILRSCIQVDQKNDLPLNEKTNIRISEQDRNHGLRSQVRVESVFSPMEWCNKMPTMVANSNYGSALFGESAAQSSRQRFDMVLCSQKPSVVPTLDNLDLSVFETTSSPRVDFSTADERLRNGGASEGSFLAGLPQPPKSTNAAVQRANNSMKPLSPLDSLLFFSSNRYEVAGIDRNNTALKSEFSENAGETLDPLADFFM